LKLIINKKYDCLHQQLFPLKRGELEVELEGFFLKFNINKKYDFLHQQLFPYKKRGRGV
jgi:hypothetical protein